MRGDIGFKFCLRCHDFSVCIRTENQNQVSFYPFALQEISVLFGLTLGHLSYYLSDVPPCNTKKEENDVMLVTIVTYVITSKIEVVCDTYPAKLPI